MPSREIFFKRCNLAGVTNTNYDSLWAHSCEIQSILGSREVLTAGNWCPICYILLYWPRNMVRCILCAGGDPGMTGCLECPLTRSVLAQSWCQNATNGAWYLTTELLSGRDRPLRLCVLRRYGWKPKTRWTGEWRLPPKQQPPGGVRW